MRVQDIDDILLHHFKEAWADETPVYLYNDVPTKPKEAIDGGWVGWDTQLSTMYQETFGDVGNRRFERNGRIYVQVFVQTTMRTSRLNELIGKVVSIYEGNRIGVAIIRSVTSAKIPTDGKWIGKVVTARYTFDEIK